MFQKRKESLGNEIQQQKQKSLIERLKYKAEKLYQQKEKKKENRRLKN